MYQVRSPYSFEPLPLVLKCSLLENTMIRLVNWSEFHQETFGGRPNQADLSIYKFEYKCACGESHRVCDVKCIRELSGMRFVLCCPDREIVALVKIRSFLFFFPVGVQVLLYGRE